MPAERSGPAVSDSSGNMGGKGVMIKAPDDLQDLRPKIYAKAKAEPGLGPMEYAVAARKTGAVQRLPGAA